MYVPAGGVEAGVTLYHSNAPFSIPRGIPMKNPLGWCIGSGMMTTGEDQSMTKSDGKKMRLYRQINIASIRITISDVNILLFHPRQREFH